MTHTDILGAVARACEYMDPEKKGGAHTDVMVLNHARLASELAMLARCEPADPFRTKLEGLAETIARRFIVKRGKIEDFSMQVVGRGENVLPRSLMSHTFGPAGYNLMPTVEKVITDSWEAAREIPYFACGPRDQVLAPDVLGQIAFVLKNRRRPKSWLRPDRDLFLSFLDETAGQHVEHTLYQVLTQDPYFKGKIESHRDLAAYQRFVRDNPLTREMEDRLTPFFDAPITVGVRDTIRWAMGSRHPELGWEKARLVLSNCFTLRGEENFLPAEVTYYSVDVDGDPAKLAERVQVNQRVIDLFALKLADGLRKRGFLALSGDQVRRIAREVLDFHHGYPIYEVEPYQGVLSVATLKLLARVAAALGMLATGTRPGVRRNRNLAAAVRRPGALMRLAESLGAGNLDRLLGGIQEVLAAYVARGGVEDRHGNVWEYHQVPRTFYSFQERADHPSSTRGRVEDMFTLEELHEPPRNELLSTLPELAEKLAVFFTLVYRYYRDTGFVADLRPRNAGRDIFILGIWGYVSDNLLVVLYRDGHHELHADLSFVDNRDQFKEFRRGEDRRLPLGLAKHAMRLTGPLVEPAMLRAIGLFTDRVYRNAVGDAAPSAPLPRRSRVSQALDIAQAVANTAIANVFSTARTTTEDTVDDLFTGVRRIVEPRS